jgi:hypothetical protein
MKLRLLALAAFAALVCRPGEAPACGGPDYGDFSALSPATSTLEALLHPDEGFASWGQEQTPEMRFLYPFWKAHPAEIDALYQVAYEGVTELPAPSTAKLDGAIASADVTREQQEARAIVDAIYAMPPVPAAKHAAVLARAVAVLEQLAGGNDPHAASRDLALLKGHVRSGIPDGWTADTRKQVPAAKWAALFAEADGWLAKYPTHPMADMVRLLKVRIHYFQGDADGAWAEALALYHARRVRALAEMRYLLLQDQLPNRALTNSIHDVELVTALLSDDSLDSSTWPALWQRAAQAPAGVGLNLQERLLVWAARYGAPGKLPAGFPSRPENPSTLWGKARAIALIQAHAWDRAVDELTSLPDDADRTLLLAQAEVQRGRPERAAAQPGLGNDARQYILGVMLDDAAVEKLCQSTDPRVRDPACLERAVRLASASRWSEATAIVTRVSPANAALWQQATQLAAARNPDHDLAWARFLDAHAGDLLFGLGNGPYRGISEREASLPVGSPEKARIADMLQRSNERWLALQAYTQWLASHSGAPGASDVLGEADGVYNRLINWGGRTDFFFGRTVPPSATSKELRRIGALVRARH